MIRAIDFENMANSDVLTTITVTGLTAATLRAFLYFANDTGSKSCPFCDFIPWVCYLPLVLEPFRHFIASNLPRHKVFSPSVVNGGWGCVLDCDGGHTKERHAHTND